MDAAKEQKRKRDRDRYARMTNEERQESKEKIKRKNKERNERMTEEERQDKLKKRREAYHQKKYSGKTPEQKATQRTQEKKYENMQPERKKARVEQIEVRRQLKRNTPSKDSIAMENPEYVATEEEVRSSKLTTKHRNRVAGGKRQTLIHERNEEFTRRRKQTVAESSKEDKSMTETCDENNQPLEQPQVMTYGKNLDFILAFEFICRTNNLF